MTVGELKEKLKDVPDDLLIVSFEQDMETCGIRPAYPSCRVMKCKKKTKHSYDRFDGTDYSYTVYEEDARGDERVFYI